MTDVRVRTAVVYLGPQKIGNDRAIVRADDLGPLEKGPPTSF